MDRNRPFMNKRPALLFTGIPTSSTNQWMGRRPTSSPDEPFSLSCVVPANCWAAHRNWVGVRSGRSCLWEGKRRYRARAISTSTRSRGHLGWLVNEWFRTRRQLADKTITRNTSSPFHKPRSDTRLPCAVIFQKTEEHTSISLPPPPLSAHPVTLPFPQETPVVTWSWGRI